MLGFFTNDLSTEDVTVDSEYEEEKAEINLIKEEISELREEAEEEIEKFFDTSFSDGVVGEMPPTEWLVEIQDGWEQKKIHQNGRFDAWLRESEPGAELPPHHHPDQNRFIVLVEGEMTLTVYDEEGEERTIELSEEENGKQVLHLPPGTKVSAESIRDTVTVQVFEPPVASGSTPHPA